MTTSASGALRADARFEHIEALLSRSPDLSQDEIGELKHWASKQASAFDIADMASRDSTRAGYARFRADHIDRFTWRDVALALGLLAMVAGTVALVAWLA